MHKFALYTKSVHKDNIPKISHRRMHLCVLLAVVLREVFASVEKMLLFNCFLITKAFSHTLYIQFNDKCFNFVMLD